MNSYSKTTIKDTRMNKIFKSSITLLTGCLSFAMVSCSDMLDVDSDRLLFEDDHGMSSINDTLYSMAGILSKLQPLADRYVLQGELRGDLLATTEKADVYLQEINHCNYSLPDNPYRNTKDYYAVINNCNYVIHNIDTTTIIANKPVTRKHYVAAKAVRAWTYLQLGLTYNTAKYYDKPILEVGDINNYDEMDLQSLISVLIADLMPFKDEEQANLGEIAGYKSVKSFYPVKLMLGDLFLMRASINNNTDDYELAAQMYYEQIIKEQYYTTNIYNQWLMSDGAFIGAMYSNAYLSDMRPGNREAIGCIVNSTKYGFQSEIKQMNDSLEIIPTENSVAYFDDQTYCAYSYDASTTPITESYVYRTDRYKGDLRKYTAMESLKEDNTDYKYIYKYAVRTESKTETSTDDEGEKTEETFSYFACPTLRQTMIFLRYAEAVNRLGKPNLAMCVLKHGFDPKNIAKKEIVPNHEKIVNYHTDEDGKVVETVSLPSYMYLPSYYEDIMNGIRMRGCGDANKDTTFVIKDFTNYIDMTVEGSDETVKVPMPNEGAYKDIIALAKQDSIAYVDSLIFLEHTLETAYEGNRFFDLYRYAKRYQSVEHHKNDNFFGDVMSKKVSDKVFDKAFFLNENNWFIPVQE